jgi:NNP family nitrate/nitrite transporter-like MFS transporter
VLLACAATAGFGGGNFSSSMFNISFFFPEGRKGFALGLNAAGGNLGVAVAQLFVPLALIVGVPAAAVKLPKHHVHMANAGLMWLPFVALATIGAWLYMDSLTQAKADKKSYVNALKYGQTWVMSFLYIGTFGSFIGFSFALPLVIKTTFPEFLAGPAALGADPVQNAGPGGATSPAAPATKGSAMVIGVGLVAAVLVLGAGILTWFKRPRYWAA